jgi:hypothetical protein
MDCHRAPDELNLKAQLNICQENQCHDDIVFSFQSFGF